MSTAPLDNTWFYARDRQRHGPVSWDQLRELMSAGKLLPTDMVLRAGTSKWTTAADIPDLIARQDTRETIAYPVNGGVPASPKDANSRTTESLSFAMHTMADEPPRTGRLDSSQPVAVPGYAILGELGRGGMGVVYKAFQVGLNRTVALKMILAGGHADPKDLARFRAEAEAVAKLQHPHIVQIYEIGEHDGLPFFTLEFVEGGSLAGKLDGTPQPARKSAELVETLARAMHAAHQRGIVHRDLKPANVLLTADGSLKVTDFGLAKQLDSAHGETRSGAILGTPSYMAPEQAAGHIRQISPQTDVYALGVILYELLTGRTPFRGESPMETILQVMSDEALPPSRIQRKLPIDLETICLKCLEKSPGRRYATAEALADDLHRFLVGEPIQARPTPALQRLMKWSWRHPAGAALALALAGLVVLTFVFVTWRWRETERAAKHAEGVAQLERKGKEDAERLSQEANKRAELEGQLAGEARKHAEAEQKRREEVAQALEKSEQIAFTSAIWQANGLVHSDPAAALRVLDDPKLCPPERRDFHWRYQYQLGHRQSRRFAALKIGSYGHKSAVSDDGRLLAAVTGNQVQIWDLDTVKAGPLLDAGHGGEVTTAFSPDNKTLATGGADGLVKLWNLPDGTLRSALKWEIADDKERHRQVYSLAFDPSGKKLAAGGHYFDEEMSRKDSDGRLRYFVLWVWDVAGGTGKLLASHQTVPKDNWYDQTSAYCLSYSPDGRTLAMGTSRPSAVWMFDVDSGKRRAVFRNEAGWVGCTAISRDGKLLAFGNTNGNVFVVDLEKNQIRHKLHGHQWHIHRCAFTDDGFLVTGSYNDGGMVRVWDPNSGEQRTVFRTGDVMALGLRARDRQVVVLTNRDAQVWSLRVAAPAAAFGIKQDQKRGAPSDVAFDEEGTHFALVGIDNQVHLWRLSREIVSGGAGKAPRFASISVKPEGTLPGHKSRTTAAAFGPRGSRLLAAGAEDGRILVWRIGDATLAAPKVVTATGQVHYLALLPDGKSLLSGADEKANVVVSLWNLDEQNPKPLSLGKVRAPSGPARSQVPALALSKDGKRLAVVSGSGETRIWDVANDISERTLPTPTETGVPLAGKGFLGVQLDPQSAGGARIVQVVPDGPAAGAGLKVDDVILQVGTEKVDGVASLQKAVKGYTSGQVIGMKIRRGKDLVEVKIALAAFPSEAPLRVAWNTDGTCLAALLREAAIVYDLRAGTARRVTLDAHAPGFTGFTAITGDLKTVAAAFSDRTVRLFDLDSGQQRGELPVLSHNIYGLAFNPDATVLATISLGHVRWDAAGEVRLWAASPR